MPRYFPSYQHRYYAFPLKSQLRFEEYLLAIHPFFSEPLDGGAFMIGSFIFDDGTYFDLTGTVDEWNGANIEEGNYEIAFEGVSRCMTVGGESLSVDTTVLILGGIQSSAMWMCYLF